MSRSSTGLVVDIRGFNPALRRSLVFSIVDSLLTMESEDQCIFVCDHEPAGLGYQIDLRKESRGRFEFTYDRRSDGAWVAMLEPKESRSVG